MKARLFAVTLILATATIAAAPAAQAQEPLSKKEAQAVIAEVNYFIQLEQYEKAIDLVYNDDYTISEKVLPSKERLEWAKTLAVIDVKRLAFNDMEYAIESAEEALNGHRFYDAMKAVEGKVFSEKTSYYRTQIEAKDLAESLKQYYEAIDTLNKNLPTYTEAYKAGNLKRLYCLCEIPYLAGYFSSENSHKISEMMETVAADYEMAKAKAEAERKEAARKAKAALAAQTVSKVFTGAPITRQEIEQYLRHDLDKIQPILQSDVFGYFDLYEDYDTDLKREVFKETDEYKKKAEQLKNLKAGIGSQVFWQYQSVGLGNYSLADGCFWVKIGTNTGWTMFGSTWAEPEKTFKGEAVSDDDELVDIVHKKLPSKRVPTDQYQRMAYHDNGIMDEVFPISVPKAAAIALENTFARIYVLFTPAGFEPFTFNFVQLNSDYYTTSWYTVSNSYYVTSTRCRVIVFDENDKVVFDKIYK